MQVARTYWASDWLFKTMERSAGVRACCVLKAELRRVKPLVVQAEDVGSGRSRIQGLGLER